MGSVPVTCYTVTSVMSGGRYIEYHYWPHCILFDVDCGCEFVLLKCTTVRVSVWVKVINKVA